MSREKFLFICRSFKKSDCCEAGFWNSSDHARYEYIGISGTDASILKTKETATSRRLWF
jgi:hypothetical protein